LRCGEVAGDGKGRRGNESFSHGEAIHLRYIWCPAQAHLASLNFFAAEALTL
jgi:hypothetical protein